MYEVVRNNKVISKHKSRKLAEKSMCRAMKKESELLSQKNNMYSFIGWNDKTTYTTGVYYVRQR